MKTKKFIKTLKAYLAWADRDYAIPMVDAMVNLAANERLYKATLDMWVKEGGSVVLRDELCGRCQTAKVLDAAANHRYPFADIWMAIDSAGMHIRRKTDMWDEFTSYRRQLAITAFGDSDRNVPGYVRDGKIIVSDRLMEAIKAVCEYARDGIELGEGENDYIEEVANAFTTE